MLQRGLRAVTAVGGTVAIAGAVKEFFIYDGGKKKEEELASIMIAVDSNKKYVVHDS